jgi:septal ring factor EnvC (AmiA/AmiB activator)
VNRRRASIVAGLLAIAAVGPMERLASADGAAPPQAQVTLPTNGNELEAMVQRLDNEERQLTTELEAIGPALDMSRRRMIARGRSYYKQVHAGLMPAGGGFDALVDHAARVEKTHRAIERDLATGTQLQKRAEEIQKRLSMLRAERAPLAAQREAMNRARTALAEADERRAAFSRAFETSNRPDRVAIYGADIGPSEGDAGGSFRAQKGHLRFPVSGRAEVHKVHRSGANGPAVEIAAALGSTVRSVAAGRVAFADRYDDYGLTVILDHGDHYFTLYANLGSSDVKVGESISAGARVGAVGNLEGKPPSLYFELRHKGDTVDPSVWLGI